MSDAVQSMQPDSSNPDSAMADSYSTQEANNTEETNGTSRRKKRKFRPDEVALANRFRDTAELGTKIPFSSLDIEMKRSVLPQRNVRLVDRGLLEVDYNEENGMIESVSINPEIWKAFEYDLTPPVVTRPTYTSEPRERRRRASMKFPATDEKYKIQKLVTDNPRREGSHGWYNWDECYMDGMTVPQYLGNMSYNRMIVTSNGTYFNGPAVLFLTQDVKSGYIGIYDSSMPLLADGSIDPSAFLKPEDIDAVESDQPDTGESES